MRQAVHVPKLVALVLGCETVGAIGALVTTRSVTTWYPTLKKPAFTPPASVFGPVWTLLYALMGVSVYLVSEHEGAARRVVRVARLLFAMQLGLNLLWSFIFFGRRSLLAALVEIAVLWVAILATMLAFARVSLAAALLMLPYLCWVSFAALLNFAIWRLNR